MNEPHPQRLAQDHDQWRLYTVAAAGVSFFAGMLVNNWIAPSSRASASGSASSRPTTPACRWHLISGRRIG